MNDKTPRPKKGWAPWFSLNHVHLNNTKIDPRVVKRKRNVNVTTRGRDETFTSLFCRRLDLWIDVGARGLRIR